MQRESVLAAVARFNRRVTCASSSWVPQYTDRFSNEARLSANTFVATSSPNDVTSTRTRPELLMWRTRRTPINLTVPRPLLVKVAIRPCAITQAFHAYSPAVPSAHGDN